MAGMSSGATSVNWQDFYTPMTNTGQVGGYSQSYIDQQNAERMRQAMLQAAQIQQANATTSGLQAQASAAGTAANNLSNISSNLTSGGISAPNLTGGSFSLPGGGITTSGTFAGAPASYTSYGGGGGTNPLSASLQEQYDPWSEHRAVVGDQLANEVANPNNPADLYRTKLAEMANGTFSPDDPSYQWRFDQGQQAAERSLAARGLLNSGNAAIELQQYGQGAASQEYGAQFDRMLKGLTANESAYDSSMQRLMSMAGVNIDPTSGGKLAVDAQNANTNAAGVGVNAAKVGADYDLGMRELLLKQYLGQLSSATGSLGGMSGTNWSAVFNT